MDCIFCKILTRQSPVSLVFEDDRAAAFMDIQPVNPGHVLVVPKRHAANLAELDYEDGAHLWRTGQRVAQALYQTGLRCEGVNFFLADGAAAGQEVFHVHLHVFPRFSGDGFGIRLGPDSHKIAPRWQLDADAEKIRAALKQI